LAQVVDAQDTSEASGRGLVDGGEDAAGIDETMNAAVDVGEISHDLPGVVDARGLGTPAAERIIERGVSASARVIKEAVSRMRAIEISPDDLPGVVDARGRSSKKGIRQGVVDRCRGAAAVEVALGGGSPHVPTICPRSLMSLRMDELATEV
jgi:hypothetical protein